MVAVMPAVTAVTVISVFVAVMVAKVAALRSLAVTFPVRLAAMVAVIVRVPVAVHAEDNGR